MNPTTRASNAARSTILDETNRLKSGHESFVGLGDKVEVPRHESPASIKLNDGPTNQYWRRTGARALCDKTTDPAQQS